MPTIINDITNTNSSLQEIDKLLSSMIAQQTDELLNATDKNPQPKTEFEEGYLKNKDSIINYVTEMIAANISSDLMNRVTEDLYDNLTTGNINPFNPRQFGQWFGGFIEREWFGLAPGNSPLADIQAIDTEIKTHSGETDRLKVAEITLENLPEGFRIDDYTARILAMYKMALKMNNFLLIRIEKMPEGQTRVPGKYWRKIHYAEISLHMRLLLKKLWDLINTETRERIVSTGYKDKNSKKIVYVEAQTGWKDGKVKYNVYLNLEKIMETYKFLEIYLYHHDLLKDIKSDDGVRRNFFTGLNRIKENWKGSNLGQSPNFDFKIKY